MKTTRLIWTWSLVSAVGCATPMSNLRKDNQRLEQSNDELREAKRAQDRKLRDLEHQLALAKEKGGGDGVIPQLPIEVVTPPGGAVVSASASSTAAASASRVPDGARIVGVADDGGEIVYEGDAALGKVATMDDDAPAATTLPVTRRAHTSAPASAGTGPALIPDDQLPSSSDRIEVTHHVPLAARRSHAHSERDAAPAPVAAAAPTGDPVGEYKAAVELVKGGKYEPAIQGLREFIQHYPRHDYADNAQYWLGEAFYAQKDFAHALTEFRATIETYPRGNKVPDALLKVGYCYQALGQAEKAHAVLEQVVNLYPKSEPAALAAKRLESK